MQLVEALCSDVDRARETILMAVYFTSLGRDGFWCRDDGMHVVFAGLVDELSALTERPQHPWVHQGWSCALLDMCREILDHSFDQVSVCLGDYLETAQRRSCIAEVAGGWRERFCDDERERLGSCARAALQLLSERDPDGAAGRVLRSTDALLWLLQVRSDAPPAMLSEWFEQSLQAR